MNERYFKSAREAMLKSDYTGSGSSPRLGAVAVYKKTILGEAWNTNKTSTLQDKYNIYRFHNPALPAKSHCETLLIQRIRWKYGPDIDWSKVDIYIYREYKNGALAMSRPCRSCFHLLKDMGISRVFYTTENGYCEERIK
jgi:tRNA(Arg) A34 adenosine deaminase TadA